MDNLTVIIPFYNGHQTIGRLVASIPDDLPVVIVDDQSDTPCTVKKQNVTVITLAEKGYFAGAVNVGIKACKTDVLILNQDATVAGDGWQDLIGKYRADYAMIGERIVGNNLAWPYGYIQGTFMFMRRDALDKIGLLDAKHFPLWGGTADWQRRACRAGYKAMPIIDVPGFEHKRDQKEQYGSSITQLLARQPDKKKWLIRTPPLVSVIVPCYNYGKYLPDLVASLIGGKSSLGDMPGQTFGGFEVILVNDASTDDTATIIAKLIDPHKGIFSVTHQTRMGTPSANNSGIIASHGRAITIMGADDMMEPWRLERLYDEWEQTPGMIVYDDLQIFGNGKRGETWKMQEYDFDRMIIKNHVHCGGMYSRKAWKDAGGYPVEMIHGREDWGFNIALGLAGCCGRHIPVAGYLYRREGHNRTLRNTEKTWAEYFTQQVRHLYPNAYRKAEDRPVACCGKGSKVIPNGLTQKALAKNAKLPGADGMTLLEYVGKSIGTSTYYGPVTGTRYSFGLSRPKRYVDNRDLKTGSTRNPGLMEMREGGKDVFRLAVVTEPTPPADKVIVNQGVVAAPVKPVPPANSPTIDQGKITVGSPAGVVLDTIDTRSQADPGERITTILIGTLRQIKESLALHGELTDEEKAELIRAEQAGHNRKSVIALFQ